MEIKRHSDSRKSLRHTHKSCMSHTQTRPRHQAHQQSTPCPRLKYIMDDELTNIDRFGVPPHLWGRQKPADKKLIERLVKPTTSHSQRQALTLKQYKRKAS